MPQIAFFHFYLLLHQKNAIYEEAGKFYYSIISNY